MAVVAVGDFDRDEMVTRIRTEFAPLGNPSSPRKREFYNLPTHEETLVNAAQDEEMPASVLQIVTKIPHRAELTRSDYRKSLVDSLFHTMMNGRLAEIARRPDAPFLGAGSARWRLSDQWGRGSPLPRSCASLEPGR